MENIIFENQLYPIREIEIPKIGEVIISTSELNLKIMNDDGSYFSETAKILDEDIFFYVESHQINLEENQLIDIIIKEL